MRQRILIIGGLPSEAGGRGSDGLSYSVWNNTRHLDVREYAAGFLADNALPRGIKIGAVPQVPWGPIGWDSLRGMTAGSTWSTLRLPYVRNNLNSAAKALWYARVVRLFRPHLIHVHGALRACLVPRAPSGPPVLTTLHGSMGAPSAAMPYADQIEANALERSDYLVTVTRPTFDRLHGSARFAGRRWVIPNGIDPAIMTPSPDERADGRRTRLLTVGSLTSNKNQRAVLEAIRATGDPECFEYTTVGSGPERDSLALLARESGIRYSNVPFVAYRELPRYYADADFHVLVSHAEGFGQSVAESLACGTPVIVSRNMDICGEPAIVNGDTAVVADDNLPATLAAVLKHIAGGRITRDRHRVTYPYSWSDVASRYMALYEEILKEQEAHSRSGERGSTRLPRGDARK